MTPTFWFVVPAHGRLRLTAICLRQLRRTCVALERHGVEANAVVVADDGNLETARELGFAWVRRGNEYLSRKFNDGMQLALDRRYNPRPADYVVPIGSDDWVDHRILWDLPPSDTVVGFQTISVVREDGREITSRFLNYPGGSGVRIYPRALLEPLGFRPADEDRHRACDTSILTNVRKHWGDRLRIEHRYLHDRQIVDWKSPGEQLNTYDTLRRHRPVAYADDPFEDLAGTYPARALHEIREHYASVQDASAASAHGLVPA